MDEKKQKEIVEDIACNIAKLSRQVTALMEGRLKEKTILIILSHSTGMSQGDVKRVLDALQGLEDDYLKD